MNARGTRRPHSRRVRSKPLNRVSGGGGTAKKGCPLTFAADIPVALSRAVMAAWQVRAMGGAR